MDSTNFLNFYDIIVNQLVGDVGIFIILCYVLISLILIRSKAPANLFAYIMVIVTGILAIQFPILRWGLVLFGLGFVGWTFMRIRRE